MVASRNAEKIGEVAAAILAMGQSALAIPVDITDAEQVEALVARTVDAFGAVDVIVQQRRTLGPEPPPGRHAA